MHKEAKHTLKLKVKIVDEFKLYRERLCIAQNQRKEQIDCKDDLEHIDLKIGFLKGKSSKRQTNGVVSYWH